MKCPKCGKEIANDSQFCEYCGVKINIVSVSTKKSRNYKSLWIVLIVLLCISVFGGIIYYEHEQAEQARLETIAAQQKAEEEARLRLEEQRRAKLERERREAAEKARAEEERRQVEEEKRQAEARAKEAERQAELARKRVEEERYQRNLPYVRQGYVDLGLPSGTLWKSSDENGFFNYEKANRLYGYKMPTKNQWEELINNCSWSYIDKDTGFKVKGSNGNYIYLPLKGCQEYYFMDFGNGTVSGYTGINSSDGEGYYFSSSSSGSNTFWRMYFRRGRRIVEEKNIEKDMEYSVRLVVRP